MTLIPIGCQECHLIWGSSEEVYMEQLPGYVAWRKLKKAIYGLKQSPREWFEKF